MSNSLELTIHPCFQSIDVFMLRRSRDWVHQVPGLRRSYGVHSSIHKTNVERILFRRYLSFDYQLLDAELHILKSNYFNFHFDFADFGRASDQNIV